MTTAAAAEVPILMYHEIAERAETASRLAVSPANFAAQLDYLRRAGFTTMTAAELSARLATGIGPLPDRPIVLTFDDGYADFHSRAMPLLDRHGFTATLFVTTGWEQDAGLRPSAPGRMLNRTQLAEAAAAGVEIAAHTRSHPQLDQLPEQLVREELVHEQAVARGRDRAGGARARVSLRLLERPGQAGGPRGGLPLRPRRRQRDREPASGPVRGAATHRPAGHHAAGIPSAGRRPARPSGCSKTAR